MGPTARGGPTFWTTALGPTARGGPTFWTTHIGVLQVLILIILTDKVQETVKSALEKAQCRADRERLVCGHCLRARGAKALTLSLFPLVHILNSVYTKRMQIDSDVLERELQPTGTARKHVFLMLFLAMIGAVLFLDAVLPLGGFWFHTALLSTIGSWSLWPNHVLFPGSAITSSITSTHPQPPAVMLGWQQMPFLVAAFLLLFLVYLLALRYLPCYSITLRAILVSTLLIGGIYLCYPVVTSPDIFSYIDYARTGVIYHLNPLTTLPTTIASDPIYPQLYWNNQPSAYGPTWAGITSLLQGLTLAFGTQPLWPMVLALRLLGLATHLCSTLLIWLLAGRLQHSTGTPPLTASPSIAVAERKRRLATLAFAWNPLLLFEACVNAHNDAQLLLLLLLALWFLLPTQTRRKRSEMPSDERLPVIVQRLHTEFPFLAIIMLALAACLKLNVVVLLPFVLLYLWKQARKPWLTVVMATLLFGGLIIVLYAPFWQNGALLNILHTNPTTYRDINTLPEFLFQLYNSIITNLGLPQPPSNDSVAEGISHTLSIGLFLLLYAYTLWRAMRAPEALRTMVSLLRWLALVWLLYCAIGTPWSWPWYLVTFFGLYALVAATQQEEVPVLGSGRESLAVSLLAFSMLSIYCFYAWAPHATFIPGLPGFQWAYLRGMWAWFLPLLALCRHRNRHQRKQRNLRIGQRYHVVQEKPVEYK